MSDTPRGAPELSDHQALPETTVNEQIRRTEAGAAHYPVADRLTAPPGACPDGTSYIIIAAATGDWTGLEGQIATAFGVDADSGWLYRELSAIDEGATAYVQDEDLLYCWSGSAWRDPAAPVALVSGVTITPDIAAGPHFALTLAHNATLANPSNLRAGSRGFIAITQDGTGTRTLAYGSEWKFPGGAPTLSTPAGTIDLIEYWAPTGGLILARLTKAYA